MVNNLKGSSAVMYQLYLILKQQLFDKSIIEEEIALEEGPQSEWDSHLSQESWGHLQKHSEGLWQACRKCCSKLFINISFLMLIFWTRALGIKKILNDSLLNGWLHVITHLKRLTNKNFEICWHMHITHHQHSKFRTEMQYRGKLWKWTRT